MSDIKFSNPILLCSAVVGVGAYLYVCNSLRFRRMKGHDKIFYNEKDNTLLSNLSRMNIDQAWEIVRSMESYEFPFLTGTSLQFALFRTYGIPSISSLLKRTNQLSSLKLASKRYADTEVLISTVLEKPPTSDQALGAILRMNQIHGHYKSKLSNEDMLFTLCLFLLEPLSWIRRFGYRELSDVEMCAYGMFWYFVGKAMEISFDPLVQDQESIRVSDGLEFFKYMERWSNSYEEKYMVNAESNNMVAERTIDIILNRVPIKLHPIFRQFVGALMDDRLRNSIGYEPVAAWAHNTVRNIQHTFRFVYRYLVLPRFKPAPLLLSKDRHPVTGRLYKTEYVSEPWYVIPTIWNQFLSVQAIVRRIKGQPLPGPGFHPEGYELRMVGPMVSKDSTDVIQKKVEELRDRIYSDLQFPIMITSARPAQCPYKRTTTNETNVGSKCIEPVGGGGCPFSF